VGERGRELGTFERVSRAGRATDRRLLVSVSHGANVRPGVGCPLVAERVAERGRLLPFWRESVEGWPLVNGSDVDDEADVGERSSGVDERALVSKPVSSGFCTGPI